MGCGQSDTSGERYGKSSRVEKPSMSSSKDYKPIIHIHVGGFGCAVGQSYWESQCLENGLGHNGVFYGDMGVQHNGEPIPEFFEETSNGRFTPRALFIDSDFSSYDTINCSSLKELFSSSNFVRKTNQGPLSTFSRGRDCLKSKSEIEEQLRKIQEMSGGNDSYYIFNSLSGGMGSGFTGHTDPKQKSVFINLIPSLEILEENHHYLNTILSLNNTMDLYKDNFLSVFFDNFSLYNFEANSLQNFNPSYKDTNKIVAKFSTFVNDEAGFQGIPSLFDKVGKFYDIPSTLFTPGIASGANERIEAVINATKLGENRLLLTNSNSTIEKASLTFQRPFSWGGVLSKVEKTVQSLSISSVMYQKLQGLCLQYKKLYKRKAYLHHYLSTGMDEQEFTDAVENVINKIETEGGSGYK